MLATAAYVPKRALFLASQPVLQSAFDCVRIPAKVDACTGTYRISDLLPHLAPARHGNGWPCLPLQWKPVWTSGSLAPTGLGSPSTAR